MIKKLKYSSQYGLAQSAGAFMAAFLLKNSWPSPDVIIPVPISLSHWLNRKYNQSELLGRSMAQFLHCPVQNALTRSSLDYSQAALSSEKRANEKNISIQLKGKQNLRDKVLLLVDDVLTTGATLEACAKALQEDSPTHIFALTFCKSELHFFNELGTRAI